MSAISFQDTEGRDWHPRMHADVIMRIGERTGITIANVQTLNVKISDTILALWYSVEKEARERKVSQQEFNESLGLPEMRQAIFALKAAFIEAFPEAESAPDTREGGGDTRAPFVPGK